METVFEHNITKEEMILLWGDDEITRDELISFVNDNIKDKSPQRVHYELLYRLYRIRGEYSTAREYAKKIPDDEDKIFSLCYHDH